MNFLKILLVCLIYLFMNGVVQSAGLKPSVNEPIVLYADQLSVDHELGLVTAIGNVNVFQDGQNLKADRVTYNRQTGIVTASGNVVFTQSSGEVSFANYAELTGDFKDGIIQDIKTILSDDSKFAAAVGQRKEGTKLRLDKAVYSPCHVCKDKSDTPPFWQVKARKILWDKKERDIVYHDAWLEILGVPALYTPYLRHPDPKVKRRSGFLAPFIGNSSSNTLGNFAIIPYFIELSESKDLTVQPILTSNAGSFLGAEYRQRFGSGVTEVKGSFGYGKRVTSPSGSKGEVRTYKGRGHIDAMLRANINKDWRWGFNALRSSDKTYLRQFPHYGHVANSSLESSVFAEGFYGRNYIYTQGIAFQGLRRSDQNEQIPVVFPSVDINYLSSPQYYGSRWSFDLNTLVLSRQTGTDMRRISLKGGWKLPYTTSRGDVFTVSALLRGDLYHIDNFRQDLGSEEETKEWRSRGFPQASLDWRYPFVRRGENHHIVVEPILTIVGAPKLGDQENIPNEDSIILEPNDYNMFSLNRYPGLDRIDDGSRFDYGVQTKVFYTSFANAAFFIGQTANLQKPSKTFALTGFEDRWSDFLGRVTANVGRYLDLQYRFRLDRRKGNIKRNELLTSIGDRFLRATFDYLILPRFPNEPITVGGRQLRVGLQTEYFDHWTFHGSMTRELGRLSTSLQHEFGAIYENECFKFESVIAKSFYEDRDIKPGHTFLFRLVFKTLGSFEHKKEIMPGRYRDR